MVSAPTRVPISSRSPSRCSRRCTASARRRRPRRSSVARRPSSMRVHVDGRAARVAVIRVCGWIGACPRGCTRCSSARWRPSRAIAGRAWMHCSRSCSHRHAVAYGSRSRGWASRRCSQAVPPANAGAQGLAMPAFLAAHSVTSRQVQPAGKATIVASAALTGAIAAGRASPVTLEEARRRLARAAAFDGITNVSSA